MIHPLAIHAVQSHMAEMAAEAEANRLARKARQANSPHKAGLVASLVASFRSHFGSANARGAASPA
jgi:alkylation response protein AidB-like acyl-CoA dehydrogenase